MQQSLDFNLAASVEAKNLGMAQAANNKKALLAYARKLAVEIAKQKGEITADDVQAALKNKGISIRALGNAAGSLFKSNEWQWTGKMVKSRRVHAHANKLMVWKLK